MSVFLVIPAGNDQNLTALSNRVAATIPHGDVLKLAREGWLISFNGTSRALSDALGISEGHTSNGIVVAIGAYWGRTSNDVWEWLKLKQIT